MAGYHIRINEIPQVVTFDIPKKKEKPKSELYHGLNSAFAEVRLMLDGKKKKKSIDEFLEEMRKE